jgi:hypothetical protein
MSSLTRSDLVSIVADIPSEWGVSPLIQEALVEAISQRQGFLCGTIEAALVSMI